MSAQNNGLRPIFSWAGGKRQVLPKLMPFFPTSFKDYYEPFAGGLSVFLALYDAGLLYQSTCHINDSMTSLVNTYETVRDKPQELLLELRKPNYIIEKTQFYENRKKYNIFQTTTDEECLLAHSVERAALFLYLSKAGYNGVHRVNLKGEYNVPFGMHKRVAQYAPDELNLETVSLLLQTSDVHFYNTDYTEALRNAKEGDFVYMDPPYFGAFTNYTRIFFGKESHIRLKSLMDDLTERGCKVAISNSGNDFVLDLFKDYNIEEIPVKRQITCKASDRNKQRTEVLIRNYT
jgi:DNA adenine methylase